MGSSVEDSVKENVLQAKKDEWGSQSTAVNKVKVKSHVSHRKPTWLELYHIFVA